MPAMTQQLPPRQVWPIVAVVMTTGIHSEYVQGSCANKSACEKRQTRVKSMESKLISDTGNTNWIRQVNCGRDTFPSSSWYTGTPAEEQKEDTRRDATESRRPNNTLRSLAIVGPNRLKNMAYSLHANSAPS